MKNETELEDLIHRVAAEPRAALRAARAIARTASTSARRVEANRLAALAARHLGDVEAARRHVTLALSEASREGLHEAHARAELARVAVCVLDGTLTEALAATEAAMELFVKVQGPASLDALGARSQRAACLAMVGRPGEADRELRAVLAALPATGAERWEARARHIRSNLRVDAGRLQGGLEDAQRAADLYEFTGERAFGAACRQNVACVKAWRGDIPAALRDLDAVEAEYERLGIPAGIIHETRAEALLFVRLTSDAVRAATRATEAHRRSGQQSALPRSLLLLARTLLASGRATDAEQSLREAHGLFLQQDRVPLAAQASLLLLHARYAGGESTIGLIAEAEECALALDAAAMPEPAADALLLAARAAYDLAAADASGGFEGPRDNARKPSVDQQRASWLATRASRLRSSEIIESRIMGWYAEALALLLQADPEAAAAAVENGLEIVDEWRMVLVARDLRVGASAPAEQLAQLGFDIAANRNDPSRVLDALERKRAASTATASPRPPSDKRLSRSLARLRFLERAAGESVLAGGTPPAKLARQLRDAEEQVQSRARVLESSLEHPARHGAPDRFRTEDLAVADAMAITLFTHRGSLEAIVIVGDHCERVSLGPAQPIVQSCNSLRFSLQRLTQLERPLSYRRRVLATVWHEVAELNAVLARLRPWVGVARGLTVVSAPPLLQSIPFAMLPAFDQSTVTVAPSLSSWSLASRRVRERARPEGRRRAVVIAGPGLAEAEAEVDDVVAALARNDFRVRRLVGVDATTGKLRSGLEGADIAHAACHGEARIDSPMFSALLLDDGRMYAYDLESLHQPPQLFVLSACALGGSSERPGEELLGLSASLLSVGTPTVIAASGPVPDAATRAVMAELYRWLAGGAPPASALARAQRTMLAGDGRDDPSAVLAAASFICLGAGWR